MSTDLRKDIEILYDLEKNNYYMTKTLQLLSGRWNKLGINKYIDKPYEPENKINQTVKDFFSLNQSGQQCGAPFWGVLGMLFTC